MFYDFFNTFLHWLAFIFIIIFIFIICLGTCKSINMLLFNRNKISFKEVVKEIFEKYLILALKFLIITTIINVLIKVNIQNITEQLTDILEIIYKSVFIIKEIPLMLNKIALASDDGIKINKSLFSFINIFPKLQSYNILAYNSDMKQSIFEVFKYKNKEFKYRNFSEMKLLYSEANRNTCLIMGNLSKSYFFSF